MAASNIYQTLQRVYHWLDVAGQGLQIAKPSDEDMRVWQAVTAAQKERDA